MFASVASVLGFKPSAKSNAAPTAKRGAVPLRAAPASHEAVRSGQTVADRRRMALRPPSFTDMLPYISYAPNEQIFVLKDGDTLGALFELAPIPTEAMPLEILDEHAKKIQEALQAMPSSDASPWIVQFFVNDDRNLDHLNQVFRDYILDQHKSEPGRGEAILSYLEMGAAGVQLGTRFVCATECVAHPNFKKAFLRASARDAMPTIQLDPRFPVIPVRALANAGTQRFMEHQAVVIDRFRKEELTKDEAQLEIEHFWAGALRKAVIDGDVENGSLMAGQSVGMVGAEQPVRGLVGR